MIRTKSALSTQERPRAEVAAVPGEEHRETRRVSLAVELSLTSASRFFAGLSGNLSEGGVFVSTYHSLEQGSLVALDFALPGSPRIVHAEGEVKWHRDGSPDVAPGVGIAFRDLSDDDRAAIGRFCSRRIPLRYDDYDAVG